MIVLSERDVAEALPWRDLIEALREGFNDPVTAPVRHVHEIELEDDKKGVLLLMPAWRSGDTIGVKLVTLFAHNSAKGLPGIAGIYALFDGHDGRALATLEGGELTARRTAAASALAADYLAREDASTFLMVGTGRLSLNIPQAYRAVRPIREVLVWGRRRSEAAKRANQLVAMGFSARPVSTIEQGLARADIVSCATNAIEPLVPGVHVRPGTHVDLIGSYKPTMRESDDDVMRRAGLIVVDTNEGAFEEAGDILQPIESGVITKDDVAGELADLCGGRHSGRDDDDQITVFKSCGCALEDLVAARLALTNFENG
ncbi:MAG: ornithine cyclodeaminase family protein [Hyphomicrobiaceae bacterium]